MLSIAEIKRYIDDDITSEKKQRAKVGQKYYEAEHDILKYRLFYWNADNKLVEDETRSNIKISHPFFMILSDQLTSYILSFKENPIKAKEKAEGLQDYLDEYFDDEFWAEIGELIQGTYNKGFEYLYAYKNEDDRLAFECADSMGVVEVRAKDTDDHCEYIIYWYIDRIEKGKKTIKRIQVWSDTETHYFVEDGKGQIVKDDSVKINPRPHVVFTENGQKMGEPLGFIPFWRLDNNKKQFSGLKPIKRIIDDYDLHACSLSNNLKDFDTPLHVVKGYEGDNLEKLQTNLKTKKIVGVDAEGGIEVKTVDVPYEARKVKLDLDKENIFIFGMGFDPTKVGDGNITNVVIQSRYTLLDLKAKALETRLKKFLKKIIKVVLDEINTVNGTDYQMKDLDKIKFEHSITTNESENIQNAKTEAETKQIAVNTILNVAANVGDEQTLKAICEVMDWNYEELDGAIEKLQEENNLTTAQSTLNSVVPEDDEPIEEPPVVE